MPPFPSSGTAVQKRDWLLINGGLSPEEAGIISTTNNSAPGGVNSLTPEQMLARYGTVSNSKNQDYKNFVSSIYGDQDRLNQTAYDTMVSTLGRVPTASEYNQLNQAFQGPNGLVNGRAAVSHYFDTIQKDPTNPNSPANPNNSHYQDYLAPYTGSVRDQYQSILGRAPTADELQHYGSILASGQTDAYGLQDYLKQLPEYTNTQDTQFRNSLNTELQGYDDQAFNKQKQGIYADYASRGFAPGNSPSLDYALTSLMGDIATQRSKYLAGLSSQQYGGNKQLAIGNYQTQLNQMYDQSQQNRQRQNQLTDYYMNRGDEGADYLTQQSDYANMMNRQKQGRNVLHTGDWINLGLTGANTAANIYGQSQRGSNPYRGSSPYDYLIY